MATKNVVAKRTKNRPVQDRYFDLIRQFPLRPLRSTADLDAAVAMIDSLIDQPKLVAAEQDYLDVLSDLVEAFESETVKISPVGDAALLRFLIDQNNSSQSIVANGSGIAESTISEVLAGKRKLNRGQIVKLSRYFHVEPGAFLTTG